jgi:hypothetical protein
MCTLIIRYVIILVCILCIHLIYTLVCGRRSESMDEIPHVYTRSDAYSAPPVQRVVHSRADRRPRPNKNVHQEVDFFFFLFPLVYSVPCGRNIWTTCSPRPPTTTLCAPPPPPKGLGCTSREQVSATSVTQLPAATTSICSCQIKSNIV